MEEGSLQELGPEWASQVGRLCAAALLRDDLTPDVIAHKVFAATRYRARYTLGFVRNGSLLGCVVGTIGQSSSSHESGVDTDIGIIKMLAVEAGHRQHGIARRLITALEERFRADTLPVATVMGSGGDYFFWPGVDVRYTPAICLFEALGYTCPAVGYNMRVDLQGQSFDTEEKEVHLRAVGIEVRRLTQADATAYETYLRQEWGDNWCAEGMMALENAPISAHIALREGRIIAFAANDTARPGWFGPTGTIPTERGAGIAAVLLRRCMQDWQAAGRLHGEICWIGPVRFYGVSVGAYLDRVFRYYTKGL